MLGLQCPKALYLKVHQPNLATPTPPSQQMIFDQGHEVGFAAQSHFPNGVTIKSKHHEAAVQETTDAINKGANTIYEGTAVWDDVLVKVDILHRAKATDKWQLIEVKSTTSVKDVHLSDVSIQANVVEGSGLPLKSVSVMHLNNECVWPDQKNLFTIVDLSESIVDLRTTIPEDITRLKSVLNQPLAPVVPIGPHCSSPYDCAFRDHCWKDVPSPSIFEIPGFKNKAWAHYANGVIRVDDPALLPLKGTRAHQVQAIVSNETWIDRKAIQHQLSKWKWPLYFLDFETINYAIPKIDGTRPYQQVPFQFSCHYQESVSKDSVHYEFLHGDTTDPRPDFAEQLLSVIGKSGSIVAYNKAFEAGCIEGLAECCPKQATALRGLIKRLVDPLPIFRSSVYSRAFAGSFSIKNVAPAILGPDADYSRLTVKNGSEAQMGFLKLMTTDLSSEDRKKLRSDMLDYCCQDTFLMVGLVKWLYSQVRSA